MTADLQPRCRTLFGVTVFRLGEWTQVTVCGRGVSVEYPAHADGWMRLSEREGRRKRLHIFGACVGWLR